MKNKFEVKGSVTAIFINNKDGTVSETLISTSDLEKVNQFPNQWYFSMLGDFKYVFGHMPGRKGKVYSLHRWILDDPKGYEIDHINHNTLDNTRNNLRKATRSQNSQNLKGAHKDSKSGIRGVYWQKNLKKWQAQICVNNKRIHLGTFDEREEAAKAVKEARGKHMPFSPEFRQKNRMQAN